MELVEAGPVCGVALVPNVELGEVGEERLAFVGDLIQGVGELCLVDCPTSVELPIPWPPA